MEQRQKSYFAGLRLISRKSIFKALEFKPLGPESGTDQSYTAWKKSKTLRLRIA
jgi:hypothetical protein